MHCIQLMVPETFEAPLQTWINELILSIGGLPASVAGLLLATLTELTGLFGVFPHMIRARSASAFLAALQSLAVSKGVAWSRHALKIIWQDLSGRFDDVIGALSRFKTTHGNGLTSAGCSTAQASLQRVEYLIAELMAKWSALHISKGISQQSLEEWEILDFEEVQPDGRSDRSNERTVELVGEISQLIDDCEGLRSAEWDELIAMLEEEHNAYKNIDFDMDVQLTESKKKDEAEDWELLA